MQDGTWSTDNVVGCSGYNIYNYNIIFKIKNMTHIQIQNEHMSKTNLLVRDPALCKADSKNI